MPAKPQSFATTSAFEVLGPIMVGPSSSHTAGALRCRPNVYPAQAIERPRMPRC